MNMKSKLSAALFLGAITALPAMARDLDVSRVTSVEELKRIYESTVVDCGDEACKANALRDVLAQREGMYLQLGTGHQACAENAKMKIWGLVPTDDESYYTEFFKAEFEKVPDSLKVKSDKQLAEEKNDGKVQTWQPGQAVDMSMFMANYNQLAANMAPAYYYDWSVGVRSANDIKILKLLKRAAEWKMLDMPAKTKHSAADEKMVKAEFAKYNSNKVLKVFIDPDWKIEKNDYGTILRRTREAQIIIADPNDKNVHLLYRYMSLAQEYQGGGKYAATRTMGFNHRLESTGDPCTYGLYRVNNYK